MIDHPKYKIAGFEQLANHKEFQTDAELRFAISAATLYYEFAFYQMMDFSAITDEMYKKESPEDSSETTTYLYRAWSNAYAMYALLRTTIEAVKNINVAFNLNIDAHYKTRVKEIIDTANDIVKHPIFNSGGSYAHQPLSLYRWGDIEVQRWTDQTSSSSQITISPEKDFYSIKNYLEHVADLVNSRP